MGKEQQRRRQRSLKTVSHIVNKLAKNCIIKHTVKIYQKDDLTIVDVHLNPFFETAKQISAIQQVSAQLTLPMISRHGENFDLLEYFDWEVIRESDKEYAKCFIRFTIFPRRYVPFLYCNECGRRTERIYRRNYFDKTRCPKHRIILRSDCTPNDKLYKILPKKLRGIKWVR